MNGPDTLKHNLLVDVARLYYLHGLTHQQIADKLGLSRVKVTRLLKEAVERKIVEFRIQDPALETLELQTELEKLFGLKRVIVTPAGDDEAQTYDLLGRYAGDFLTNALSDGTTLGLGWGTTLNAMLPYLRRPGYADLNVVSLTGGLAANANQPNPYDTTTAVAEKLGAQPHYMLVPAIAESPEAKDMLMREGSVRDVIAWWDRTDIAMMSIGVLSPQTGIFYTFADPESEVARTRELGGVGDLLAQPFDREGRVVQADYVGRTITADFARLKRIPLVVGIAGGERKVPSIGGALRTGCLDVLITDETAARRVAESVREDNAGNVSS